MQIRLSCLVAVSCLLLADPAPVAAQQSGTSSVYKCIGRNGVVAYTDRSCNELQMASAMGTPGAAQAGALRIHCSRTLQELMTQLAYALQTRDANRIAELYDWAGVSSRTGYAVMNRLAQLGERQVIGIEPVFRELAPPPPPLGPDGLPLSVLERSALAEPVPHARRVPSGLRVQAMTGNQGMASTTQFGLRKHSGCWWITL